MFQFKQFKIEQDQCAMKVCTDSCVFGAYIPVNDGQKVLDIGTGTGLLSLMIAQKAYCQITAVEIDTSAALQAAQNVANSPFKDQITVIETDIKDFTTDDFDLVICNPPFFEKHLISPDQFRNKAMHLEHLSLEHFAKIMAAKTSKNGTIAVLLPLFESDNMENYFEKEGFLPFEKLYLRHQNHKKSFRQITLFKKEPNLVKEKTLTIFEEDNKTYTQEFGTLLKDYYIIF